MSPQNNRPEKPAVSEDDPARWPLLQLLGTRTLLISGGRLWEQAGTPAFPPDLVPFAESEERNAARFDPQRGRQWPGPPRDPIWACAIQLASHCGGLRVHDPFALDIQVQAFCQGDSPFPIVYVQGPAPTYESRQTPTVLVWYNPEGDVALPSARAEAESIGALFRPLEAEVSFVARTLARSEATALLTQSDIIAYLGHGQCQAGHVAVPCADGLLPLNQILDDGRERVVLFGGCIESGQGAIQFPAGCGLYPCGRLADRPSSFLIDLVREWTAGRSLLRAYRQALHADRLRGDFRWRIFRFQGDGPWVQRPIAYS